MKDEGAIQVWDILIRLFHWSLVIFFTVAYFTAEEENIWHIYSGYAVLGLVGFRVVWGFVGSQYARFSNFIYSPGAVLHYLKGLVSGHPVHYVGHNPAGGWMAIALLVSLLLVTVSGLELYAVEEGLGPFAGVSSEIALIGTAYADKNSNNDESRKGASDEHEDEFWEEIHEVATDLTLFLIFLHIAGVLVSSRIHKENLVKAMITGKKNA